MANAVFSAGGALIMLAIISTVLPIQAIVPIHSTLLIGARVYIELPEAFIATAISVLMLIALWLPKVTWRPRIHHPWAIVGFIHTLISTLFAYGALLHSVILHIDLKREQVVGG